MALATVITDLVTHLQLSIMNTSEKNNDHFVYETPHLLLLVMVLQVLVIIFSPISAIMCTSPSNRRSAAA